MANKKPTGLEGVHDKIKRLQKRMDDKVQVGYRADIIARKEGEIWEENDTKWTIKNGIKQNIPKLNEAKTPWWCPQCEKAMNHKLDTKFYRLYNMCLDCHLNRETKMRIDGTWAEFDVTNRLNNEKAWLRDKIQESKDYIKNFSSPKLYFEDGRYEEIAPAEMFKEILEKIKVDIQFMTNQLAYLETLKVAKDGSVYVGEYQEISNSSNVSISSDNICRD